MFYVGQSVRRFHDIWPNSVPSSATSPLRRVLRGFILKTRWLLPPLTWLADMLTSIWCPNPFMRYVLMACYVIGSQRIRVT
jgi:hypothetical protein